MKPSLHSVWLAGVFAAAMPSFVLADTVTLPDAQFAPEGISNDKDGNLYVGSLTQGRLIKIAADTHEVTSFAAAGANGMVTVVGVHVENDSLFVCSSDPGISALTGTAAPALVAFDVATGAPSGRYPLPEDGAFCNDIAALPDGTILATDSFVPRIYALKPGSDHLEIWLDDDRFAADGFNLNGIAYDDGAVFVARYNTGTLHQIEIGSHGDAGQVTEFTMPREIHGADGLTAVGNGRFLLVEGGGLSAGARGALWGVKVADEAVTLDEIATDLNVPTTAAVVGTTAYVVEGQLDHLFDAEAAGPADPYRILSIELPDAYQ